VSRFAVGAGKKARADCQDAPAASARQCGPLLGAPAEMLRREEGEVKDEPSIGIIVNPWHN
jgi:hypothetical protein